MWFLFLQTNIFILLVQVRLDTMVTVVDSYNFLKDFNAKEGVLDREELIKELGLAPPPQNEGQVPTKEVPTYLLRGLCHLH